MGLTGSGHTMRTISALYAALVTALVLVAGGRQQRRRCGPGTGSPNVVGLTNPSDSDKTIALVKKLDAKEGGGAEGARRRRPGL